MGDVRIPDINNITVAGRLGRDPELRYTASGMAYLKFSVCHSKKYRQGDDWKERATWLDVTVFKEAAERLSHVLRKGSAVLVEGTLQQEKWNDKDGNARERITVLGSRVQPLEWPEKDGDGGRRERSQAAPSGGGDGPPEDDIPF
jgi:single-strand DNA-binding protein